MFRVPEKFRVTDGRLATPPGAGPYGAFVIPQHKAEKLTVIASSDGGWEHVSVSTRTRTPTWEEMCRVKSLFWEDSDCVVQYHPPKSDHINIHPYCLHLWRPTNVELPRPPIIMV